MLVWKHCMSSREWVLTYSSYIYLITRYTFCQDNCSNFCKPSISACHPEVFDVAPVENQKNCVITSRGFAKRRDLSRLSRLRETIAMLRHESLLSSILGSG